MSSGLFITFEGGEGTGKSLQSRKLVEKLTAAGYSVLHTREPGGSEGAEEIRDLLVRGDVGKWDATTEMLLHFAARRDHLRRTVWPALKEGKIVISDRFADSTRAYQGYGHKDDLGKIETLYDLAVGDFKPDLTLILDIPVQIGLKRSFTRGGGEDRYERMGTEFHERLRAAYKDIAAHEPDRCALIDATGTIDEVEDLIWGAVEKRLKPKG